MIEIKLADVMNSMETLQKLAGQTFKGKTAFQIARILKKLDEEIKTFNDTRAALINKYGKRNENGELIVDENGNCSLKEDGLVDFNKELSELLNTVIEVNAEKLNVEELSEGSFTPGEMIVLEPFFKE